MAVTIPLQRFRVEEVAGRMPDGVRWELVNGEVRIMSPAGFEHGRVAQRIAKPLSIHVDSNDLGAVSDAETGFVISDDTLRAPDVAFVAKANLPADTEFGFLRQAPDLAVEVVSPGESAEEAMAKARMWVDAGSAMTWIAWPHTRCVTVRQAGRDELIVSANDTMPEHALLPGFTPSVADFFN